MVTLGQELRACVCARLRDIGFREPPLHYLELLSHGSQMYNMSETAAAEMRINVPANASVSRAARHVERRCTNARRLNGSLAGIAFGKEKEPLGACEFVFCLSMRVQLVPTLTCAALSI